jgi:hypothetical protein
MATAKSYYNTYKIAFQLKRKRIQERRTIAQSAAAMKIPLRSYLLLESRRNPDLTTATSLFTFLRLPERDFLIEGPGTKDPKTR